MPLTQYADIAAQNLGWLIAIGFIICLLFFTFIVSLRRKVSRLQKELERVSEDVAGLRLAEETRFFTELSPFNADDTQETGTPRKGRNIKRPSPGGGAEI